MITGKRAIVYIKHKVEKNAKTEETEFVFRGREVLLGPKANDVYTVRYGLVEGEEIVVAGAFKIDADLQIKGQMSMMNPAGGVVPGGHNHGGAHHGHGPTAAKPTGKAALEIPVAFRLALTPLYSAYFSVTNAYHSGNRKAIQKSLRRLIETAANVDPMLLKGKTRDRFREVMNGIVFAAEQASRAKTDADAKHRYALLSGSTVDLVKEFGHALNGAVYVFHAKTPMTHAGKLLWIQAEAKPVSPYGGNGMVMGKPIEPSGPVKATPEFLTRLRPVLSVVLRPANRNVAERAPQSGHRGRGDARRIESSRSCISGCLWQTDLASHKQRLAKVPLETWSKQSVERQRQLFKRLSAVMFELVDYYGHLDAKPYYKAFCPMAFKDTGAFWLQSQKDIVNPYFSGGMRGCGETKREFRPVRLTLPKDKGSRP